MKRKDFLKKGMIGVIGSPFIAEDIFSIKSKKLNEERYPRKLSYTKNGEWKEFEIYVDIYTHTPVPGIEYHTLAFNDQIPGPEIRVKKGDKVRVKFINKTELNHTIHWHGLYVPWRMDGVPLVTQLPVMPGTDFIYEFEAEPPGTHMYHCHWGTLMHMQSGMYAPFIVEDPEDPIKKEYQYDRDYTLMYSAHDINFMRNELNFMLGRMKERMFLMRRGRFDSKRWAVFNTYEEFEEAVNNGYNPPYVKSRRSSAELPMEQIFTVNGRSYPATPKLYIREGETIRVRLINGGNKAFYLHLHGHDFWQVADDGQPLASPIHQNTIPLFPGKTNDIIIEGTNRGIWTFHDHDTRGATNNGLYPGGTLTTLVYEDLPEEEKDIARYSGNSMFRSQDNMHGHQGSGHQHMMFGGPKLPKIALDE